MNILPSKNLTQSNFTADINIAANCKTTNCIYLLGCKRCPQQYIGETDRSLKERFLEHKGYVNNHVVSKATGFHFNQKGHTISDMEVTVVEKIFNVDPQFRKQREKCLLTSLTPITEESTEVMVDED